MIKPEVLLRHRPFLRNLVRGLVDDDETAADLEQKTLLEAIGNPPRNLDSLRPWLRTVARNFHLKNLRSQKRHTDHRDRVGRNSEATNAKRSAAEFDARRRLVAEVMNLEEPYRAAIILYFYHNYSCSQIAELLSIRIETARSRVRLGLTRLKVRLTDGDGDGDGVLGLPSVFLLLLDSVAQPGPESLAEIANPLDFPTSVGGSNPLESRRGSLSKVFSSSLSVSFSVLLLGFFFVSLSTRLDEGPMVAASSPVNGSKPRSSSTTEESLIVTTTLGESFKLDEGVSPGGTAVPPQSVKTGICLRVELHDGSPASSVWVACAKSDSMPRWNLLKGSEYTHRTGKDGTLVLSGLSSGSYTIATLRGSRQANVTLQADEMTYVTVRLLVGKELRGTVRDPATGEPIADAVLFFSTHRWTMESGLPVARTEADGTFVIPAISSIFCYLGARAPGCVDSFFHWIPSTAGSEVLRQDFSLEVALPPISGQVVGPEGEPVSNARVVVVRQSRSFFGYATAESNLEFLIDPLPQRTTTDEGGGFVLRGLARNSYVLSVIAEGLASVAQPLDLTLVDSSEEPSAISVQLRRGAVLSGQIVGWDPAAKPCPTFTVRNESTSSMNPPRRGRISSSGSFRVDDLAAGRVELFIDGKEEGQVYASLVLAEGEEQSWHGHLDPRFVISGRIVDELGVPHRGVRIVATLHPLLPVDVRGDLKLSVKVAEAITDQEGRFRIPNRLLKPHRLDIFEDLWAAPLTWKESVLPESEIEVVVPRNKCSSAVITGRLASVDASVRVTLSARPLDRGVVRTNIELKTVPSSDGSFELGPLPPGRVTVYVLEVPKNRTEKRSFLGTFTLEPNEVREIGFHEFPVNGRLRASLTLCGSRVDQRATLKLKVLDDELRKVAQGSIHNGVTEIDLPPGRFSLVIESYGLPLVATKTTPFEILAGETTDLAVDLELGSRVFVSLAKLADQTSTRLVEVSIKKPSGELVDFGFYTVWRQSAGRFFFLAPGEYRFEARTDLGRSGVVTLDLSKVHPFPTEVLIPLGAELSQPKTRPHLLR